MPPEYIELKISDQEKPSRRAQTELILDILETIPIDEVGSVERISAAVKARWSTTRKYLELIALIQAAPKIRVYGLKGGNKKVYRREAGSVRREIVT